MEELELKYLKKKTALLRRKAKLLKRISRLLDLIIWASRRKIDLMAKVDQIDNEVDDLVLEYKSLNSEEESKEEESEQIA